MENKKTNAGLVAIIVVLCLLILGILGYVFYNKMMLKNGNGNEVIDEVHYTESWELLALKNDKDLGKILIAVDNDGNEKIIYKWSDYDRDIEDMQYYYDKDAKLIYLSINSYEMDNHREDNQKWEIATIDVTENIDNYELNVIKEIDVERNYFDKMVADNIAKVGDKLIFANSRLYEMNLDNYEINPTDITSTSRQITVLSYNNDTMIYNEDKTIYKYNYDINIGDVLVENAIIEYIHGNKLIYEDLTNNDATYYSYDFDTEEIEQISEPIGRGLLGFSYVIPYNDTYLSYTLDAFHYDGNDINLSCDDIDIDICNNYDIDSYIIYGNTLLVTGYANSGPNDDADDFRAFTIKIDLNDQNIISTVSSTMITGYRHVTYLK